MNVKFLVRLGDSLCLLRVNYNSEKAVILKISFFVLANVEIPHTAFTSKSSIVGVTSSAHLYMNTNRTASHLLVFFDFLLEPTLRNISSSNLASPQFVGIFKINVKQVNGVRVKLGDFPDDVLLGVLDIDSPLLSRFDKVDQEGLQAVCLSLMQHVDWSAGIL